MPKGKRKKGGPVMLDIKLRYIGPEPPTKAMVRAVFEHMLATGGEVPDQWLFAAIDWSRPGKGSQGFRAGSIANFAQFAPIIRRKLDDFKASFHRSPGR